MPDPNLPQTSPQGGPNPNSMALPTMAASVGGQLTGAARAAAPDPQAQSGRDWVMNGFAPAFPVANTATALAGQLNPGITGAISNWWNNAPGSAGDQDYNARVAASTLYGRPDAQAAINSTPDLAASAQADPVGFSRQMGPILDAMTKSPDQKEPPGVIAHPTVDGPPVYKSVDDPELHRALVGYMTGAHPSATPQNVHALQEPHKYTDEEYLKATQGLSRVALKNMWEMQHYLNPQQQAQSLSLAMAAHDANVGGQGSAAAQEYQKLLRTVGIGALGMTP